MKIIPPPIIAFIYILAVLALDYVFPTSKIINSPYNFFGLVIALSGFSIMTWGWYLFRKTGTALRPTDKPTTLVVSGPYQFTRNPMYLGMVIILLGLASYVGTLPIFIAPLAFLITINKVFIPHEEKTLEKIFGKKYLNYKSRVRQWL